MLIKLKNVDVLDILRVCATLFVFYYMAEVI